MIRLLTDLTPCHVECACGASQLYFFTTHPHLRADLERDGWRIVVVDGRADHICPSCCGGAA